eukprot:s8176_g1.t1
MKRPYNAQHILALRLCSAGHWASKRGYVYTAQCTKTGLLYKPGGLRLRDYTSVYHNSFGRLWSPEVRWARAGPPLGHVRSCHSKNFCTNFHP